VHTRSGAIGRILLTTNPEIADLLPLTSALHGQPRNVCYRLREANAHAPRTTTMTANLRTVLGADLIGTATLNLLNSSLASTMYMNYKSGMRELAAFCHEEGSHPLQAIK
jgi:hypothetical protein